MAALAEVDAEWLPALPLLVRSRSLSFLLPDLLLWYVSGESHPELRLSNQAVLAREVLQAKFSVEVKLVPLAVPLVAGAADEGATELLAQWLASGRLRLCHKS